jgi:hypothetical protein
VYYGEETVARNGAVYCALAAHFPHVMLTPRATNYLLASSGPLCADPAELGWRMTVQNIQAQYVNQYYFDYLLAPDDAATLTERYAQAPRMNRDLEPVACQQALLLWGRADAGRLANALRALASWPLWAMGLLFLGVVLVGAGASVAPWRRGAGTRWRGLLAVTAAGFAGMALNVLVLLLAQVTLGALYALLGALMAVGMAGIAVGAWLAGRLRLRLIAPLLLGLALALLLPLLAGPAAAWPFAAGVGVLGLLAALAGVMVGAAFPLAVAAGLSPAAIYAADLLGAAAAGLLVGAVLLPAHGLLAACLLLAGMLGLVCIVCRKVTSAAL